jgi:hypothetical protein
MFIGVLSLASCPAGSWRSGTRTCSAASTEGNSPRGLSAPVLDSVSSSSFAQFEREIISERIRDKFSAARRKRKWIGGWPVLGYNIDPKGGSLIVTVKEAA